ncbi:MAG: hypothetical protein WC812_00435 [Candidatus Pacearchaeota archaeon]|jgi:hypothetical protein
MELEKDIKITPSYKRLESALAFKLKQDSGKMASGKSYFGYWNEGEKPIKDISIASIDKYNILKLFNANLNNTKMLDEICNLLEQENLSKFTYYAAHGIGDFRLFINEKYFNEFTKKFKLEVQKFNLK